MQTSATRGQRSLLTWGGEEFLCRHKLTICLKYHYVGHDQQEGLRVKGLRHQTIKYSSSVSKFLSELFQLVEGVCRGGGGGRWDGVSKIKYGWEWLQFLALFSTPLHCIRMQAATFSLMYFKRLHLVADIHIGTRGKSLHSLICKTFYSDRHVLL